MSHHLWLPYCQMKTAPVPQQAVRTEGSKIYLKDGRVLVDGVASWWTAAHGYNHPHIVSEMKRQLDAMPHVMLGGLVHEPALRLSERLAKLTGLPRVFFSDSGSVAVEVALKMALQYWRIRGMPHKERFLCFHDGYHGDTLGAMSVSDPERGMHKAFKKSVIRQYVVNIPTDEYEFAELDNLLGSFENDVAGIIIEPLVQGAGGMKFHSADVLAELYRLAQKHGILFIADEVATGFGRTGNLFAVNEAGITPDILCLGKALTGGAVGMGATLASQAIYDAFLSDDPNDAFMHGPTFMGNPLACAAANASLDLFEKEPRLEQVATIEEQLTAELAACEGVKGVRDVRVKGAIGVVEMDSAVDVLALRPKFLEQDVWIRPFGNIVYVTPAFTISKDELSQLTGAIKKVLGSN